MASKGFGLQQGTRPYVIRLLTEAGKSLEEMLKDQDVITAFTVPSAKGPKFMDSWVKVIHEVFIGQRASVRTPKNGTATPAPTGYCEAYLQTTGITSMTQEELEDQAAAEVLAQYVQVDPELQKLEEELKELEVREAAEPKGKKGHKAA